MPNPTESLVSAPAAPFDGISVPIEREGASDRARIPVGIVASLVVVALVLFGIRALARIPRPPPVVIAHSISLSDFELRVVLSSAWTLEPGPQGTHFVASNADTGATLAGAIDESDRPIDLDVIIDRIVEDQRAGLGTPENISRGAMAVGLLDAGWVKLSFARPGDALRVRTVAVRRDRSTLTLTCTGGVAAQKACDGAIRSISMAR